MFAVLKLDGMVDWRNVSIVLFCLLVVSLLVNYHYYNGYDHINDELIKVGNDALLKERKLQMANDSITAIRAELKQRENELRNYKYEKPKDLPYRVSDMQQYWERFRSTSGS